MNTRMKECGDCITTCTSFAPTCRLEGSPSLVGSFWFQQQKILLKPNNTATVLRRNVLHHHTHFSQSISITFYYSMSSSVSFTVSATQQMQRGCARAAHASMAQQRHSLSKRMCGIKASALSFNTSSRSLSINVSCKVRLTTLRMHRRVDFHQYTTIWRHSTYDRIGHITWYIVVFTIILYNCRHQLLPRLGRRCHTRLWLSSVQTSRTSRETLS